MMKAPMRWPVVAVATLLAGAFAARAAMLEFSSAAQYDGNFWQVFGVGTVSHRATEGGFVRFSSGGGANFGVVAYDTTPDANPTNTGFDSYALDLDVRFSVTTGASLGVYTRGTGRGTSDHLLALLNPDNVSGTQEQARFFSGATPSAGGAGTLWDSQTSNPNNEVTVNTWYHYRLLVSDGTMPTLTMAVFRADMTPIFSKAYTYTAGAAPSGELILRLYGASGGVFIDFDNFAFIVPEPASLSLLALGGLTLLRRRRDSRWQFAAEDKGKQGCRHG